MFRVLVIQAVIGGFAFGVFKPCRFRVLGVRISGSLPFMSGLWGLRSPKPQISSLRFGRGGAFKVERDRRGAALLPRYSPEPQTSDPIATPLDGAVVLALRFDAVWPLELSTCSETV